MKRISIAILITTLLILISGCGNKTVDTQPNIIMPGNSSLTVQVEWPTNPMTSLRNAPPAYLGLATVEVFLMEKEFATTVFGTSFVDYINSMESHFAYTAPKRSDIMGDDFVNSIRGTEYEDKMYYYAFDVMSSNSPYKDGATIDNIVVGDYIMFLYGLQSSEFVSTYAIKSVSISENQAASVTVYASDWITNSPVSQNSISLISGYYSTPTVSSSLDVLNASVATVDEGTASFAVTYIFTYNGDVADLDYLVTSNFISGTSTPENGNLSFSPVTITTINSGTYQASFSATNIDSLTVPTDITAKSGFTVGFQISEIIADEATGISDWNNFTLYIQDTGASNASPTLNLVSFAVTSVSDFDYLYYHAGTGDTQDPRTNNAASIADIQGATIDLALDSTNTNQKIVIIYEDLTSTLSLHAGANPVAGTDFTIYKADDISKTDISSEFFTSAAAYTGSGEKGIELYFDPIMLEDTAGTYGFGSYILEVNAIDGDNSYTEKYHIFLENGLYVSDQSAITSSNDGSETSGGSNIWKMMSADGTGHFVKGNISPVVYPTTVNGYTKFYASCEVGITPRNWQITIPIEADQIDSGLKILSTTDIVYSGLGADTNNNEALYIVSLINNGFEFTSAGTAAGADAKLNTTLSSPSVNQYELKLNFTDLTQNDITDLPLEGGEHVCWYAVHLVNKDDIGSGVYAKGRKYIFFGKIYFKIQV